MARACDRHREALAGLAERSIPTLEGGSAVAHVERCGDCAEVLGDLMLTVVALRRMAEERPLAGDASIDGAWPRLRDRIERSRRAAREQAWRWRTSLGGLLASALVVAALVGPATLHFGPASVDLAQPISGDRELVSRQIEAAYVNGARALPASVDTDLSAADSSGYRRYPDDLRPAKKEVAPSRSSALSPDPH